MRNAKLKVLLVAYACRPNAGTEYGVGWHFFKELLELVDLHLITEAGYRDEIINELSKYDLPSGNITFIDIGKDARILCDRQGSWSFYYFYRQWQFRAYLAAKELVLNEKFDLVHHLNMIGYREPGFMYRLKIPLVIGPLGGFGNIPLKYMGVISVKSQAKEFLKILLNILNTQFPRIRRSIKSADLIIAAVPEAKLALRKFFGVDSTVIPETGCLPFFGGDSERKHFLWVGKEVERKMFHIAASAFSKSKMSEAENLLVVGEFSVETVKRWRSYKNIIFIGNISHAEVLRIMGQSRALVFPSVHEGNPHVIFEAISRGTPVICHDTYGMGSSITESIGIKVKAAGISPSIRGFSAAIDSIASRDFKVANFSKFCELNSWPIRAASIHKAYIKVLKKWVN
jgi:glycosyltransferase involved in cell wall biosynthesis